MEAVASQSDCSFSVTCFNLNKEETKSHSRDLTLTTCIISSGCPIVGGQLIPGRRSELEREDGVTAVF